MLNTTLTFDEYFGILKMKEVNDKIVYKKNDIIFMNAFKRLFIVKMLTLLFV